MSLKEDIIETITNTANIDSDIEITGKSKLTTDLGIDSLDSVEITMALEDAYGISITEDDMRSVKTINDLYKMVKEKADIDEKDEDEDEELDWFTTWLVCELNIPAM